MHRWRETHAACLFAIVRMVAIFRTAINMSYVSTFNALNINTLTSGQKLTLAVIASFERAGKAWPSVATIAKRASLSVRSVNYHIAALIKLGYIQRIYRTGRSAITRLFIGETPAKIADTTPANVADKSVITESVNQIPAVHEPTTIEPSTETASAALVVSDIEQPEQPIPAITDIEQHANTTTEALKTPYSASNEPEGTTTPTDTATPAVEHQAEVPATQDQAVEADPAMAEWAKVDPQVLLDLIEIRREKRKGKPKTTEIKHWYSIALESGFTLAQIAYAMVLNNWSKLNDASWLEHVPRPQMTATGAPAIPAAPKVWTPDLSHIPASATTLAAMKEKIRQMKERWAASELAQTAPPPMRQ